MDEPSFAPPVTLLKPLKGCDETAFDSLRSWFDQNYSEPMQILLGVADANDPVCEIARELIRGNPDRDAQLIICSESLGINSKVSTLIQLERYAKYELMLISDADVRVPRDFLANMVVPMRDDRNGLVHCFYRLADPTTLAMRWEAVAINADFWSQVLQAGSIKAIDFALGAVMLVRRKALTQIGDFKSLANCLADDYQLGHRIAEKGYSIALCPVVVECWEAPASWGDVWRHQLRWARTIRACQPLAYFFSILSNATFWPLLWLIVSLAKSVPACFSFAAIACVLLRIVVARNLQRRLTPERKLVSPFWLVPIKDLLQVVLWLGAFLGSSIEWRGQRMELRNGGTLVENK